jgi:hypothetical protein
MTDPNVCHGCGKPQKGGVVTICSSCGNWGLFGPECLSVHNEGSCSKHVTKCDWLTRQPAGGTDVHLVRGTKTGDRDYFSASQIEHFALCARKWAWRYLDGISLPPNPYAAFGLDGHGQIEKYLVKGVPFDLTTDPGEAAMAGLHFLPRPGTANMVVEGQFTLDAWGHKFLGYKDIQINRRIGDDVLPDRAPIVESNLVDPLHGKIIPLVIDHKFTGSFKWKKTAEILRNDPQAVLYAAHAMVETGAPACDLRWIYYKRVRPWKAEPVDLRVYRENLEAPLTQIRALADEMARYKKQGVRALDLAPNPGACGAFGGCPYAPNCGLSPRDRMIGIMSDQSLEARKSAFLANIGAPPGGQPPQPGATTLNPSQGFQPPPVANGAPPGAWGQPPPQFAPPGPPQFAPPPQNAAPVVDEQVLVQARARHPGWNPGEQWWNGGAFVQPGDPAYPPIFAQPPQGTPPGPPPNQDPPPNSAAEEGGKGKGGRPKKNQEAIELAASGLTMIGNGFLTVAQALGKGLI